MKFQYKYREEEADPLVDYPDDVPTSELIKELKLSRKMLVVAEDDKKIFQEDYVKWLQDLEKERRELNDRKELAELAIQCCDDWVHPKNWLENLWVEYGRPREESLPMKLARPAHIKMYLRRKINLKRRAIDRVCASHRWSQQERQRKLFNKRQLSQTLEQKTKNEANLFKSEDISNFVLHTMVRQTRELTVNIKSHMTHFDMLTDTANKFSRVREYLHDDHYHFARMVVDAVEKIREQERQLRYLDGVFKEAQHASYLAKMAFDATDRDLRLAHEQEKKMLRDLKAALEEHRKLCNTCLKDLVTINDSIKKSLHVGPTALRRFPFYQTTKRKHDDDVKGPLATELTRTFELLQGLTQSRTPDEVLKNIRHVYLEKNAYLETMNNQISHLIQTILIPEEKMFDDEVGQNTMTFLQRQESISATFTKLQNDFDNKTYVARRVIDEQLDTADEFEYFIDVMQALNRRIGQTFGTIYEDESFLENHPGLPELLELTARNIIEVCSHVIPSVMSAPWESLQDHVEHRDFLEYRSKKLPHANDRTIFDQPILDKIEERRQLTLAIPKANVRYLTSAQIKEANWQLKERARLAELHRLKVAEQKDAEEKAMLEAREAREKAAKGAAEKKKVEKK
ncbi:hypothetical protein RvY_16837 [Ramazzottius varieornatus]|uniref:Uncharacterized protein n=1 Tax=Ramazzottius varieornatus TaxID=947166 RepID=A0A1D1W777_RAMVA|nr:hypothetical protein RvY_16837 [Ramazzottius varieornatus]